MHFSFFFRFSIGCGSKFRAEVVYLEVGSSDFGIFSYILVYLGLFWSMLVCSVCMQRWYAALVCSVGMPASQTRVGDDDGDGDDGRIFPEHPSPILHAPRDIISRKGKSLTPIYIYIPTGAFVSPDFRDQVGSGAWAKHCVMQEL